jgi:glycosyltransferase involved in cell wall biosynthesis
MPAYNAQRWIEQALRSALDQTWRALEVIVVDDGSHDATVKTVRSMRSPRVRLIEQENAGPCVARNRALAQAQGEYVQWLDADDLLAPDKVERQLRRLRADGSEHHVAAGPTGTFRDDPRRANFVPNSCWTDLAPAELLVRKLRDNAHIVIHSWLIGRQLAEQAGPWDDRLRRTDADGEYSSRMVARSAGMLFVPDARCYYRKGIVGSLSATRHYMEQEQLLLELLFSNLLLLEDSQRTRSACAAWLGLWSRGYCMVHREAPQVALQIAERFGLPAVHTAAPVKFQVTAALLGWERAVRLRNALASWRRRVTWGQA